MKHRPGKSGKRPGPISYRTASSFLHRKARQNKRLKSFVLQLKNRSQN